MLAQRLARPDRAVALEALAAHWAEATVTATVPGHAAVTEEAQLMNRIRGAVGRLLMGGASAEALAGAPCPWIPPCALDVLFREQARLGKHGIPKPWVLELDRRGLDLVVRIRLFGFAIDWCGAVAHVLAQALRERIDWATHAPGRFLPSPEVARLEIAEAPLRPVPPRPVAALVFLTPLDAAGDDPLDRPATVVGRLARRIDLMSRWMGIAVEADWRSLASHWNSLAYDPAGLRRRALARRSGRSGRGFAAEAVEGTLTVAGDLAPIWPLVTLGQSCHAGRGATAGLGRYRLD